MITPLDYSAQLAATPAPQLPPQQRPPLFQGLAGALFPTPAGMDPAAAQSAQNQALMNLGLGMMSAGARPGASFGGALSEGFLGASRNYSGAMDAAFRNTLAQQEAERRQKREEREAKESDRTERQQSAITAGRLAQGIAGAADPVSYLNLVRDMPEVQSTLAAYGIDPASLTTPEEIQAAAEQLGSASMVGGPVTKPTPLQLKAVKGPDGKPILVPEQMAVGQEPFYKTGGLSVTLPDGTVISEGMPESIRASELSKPTVNKLQESIVASSDRLDRINVALDQYDPEFLRARGLSKAWTTKVKDFAGLNVSEEDRAFLAQMTEFQSSVKNDLSLYLNQLSGAAISPEEYKRLSKSAPTGDELSPAEFEAKARATVKNTTRAIMRANWALRNGIGIESVDQLSKIMPLESIDQVYKERANEIWRELGGLDDTKAEAIRRANAEFGLAR